MTKEYWDIIKDEVIEQMLQKKEKKEKTGVKIAYNVTSIFFGAVMSFNISVTIDSLV